MGGVYGKVVEIVEWGGDPEAGGFERSVEGRLVGDAESLGLRRANSKASEDGDAAEVDGMCN